MALPSLFSPRRLALLSLFLLVLTVTFLQTSRHINALPQGRLHGFITGHEDFDQKHLANDKPSQTSVQESAAESGWFRKAFGFDRPWSGSAQTLRPTTRPVPSFRTRPTYSTISKEPPSQVKSKIQSVLDHWTPPTGITQWPPYEWYGEADYDPNAWEGFEWDNAYYVQNGVKGLASQTSAAAATATPTPYLPYPRYNSPQWKTVWKGEYVPCIGPRGKRMNESSEDVIHAWPNIPEGFPEPAIGDANAAGIDIDHCFDRYHRYGPYGYSAQGVGKVEYWQQPVSKPDWSYTSWGRLQNECVVANEGRFAPVARSPINTTHDMHIPEDHLTSPNHTSGASHGLSYRSRTAVLIRTWEGYTYKDNDIEAIRALIAELNLLSGGEYQVFLFVNIKDPNLDIHGNPEVYRDLVKANVPQEFWDTTILWNERLLEKWYPAMGHWNVYWHQFMAVQWFSKMYPEFDFVWNWETDARYTGNHYHFLEQIADFSRKAPRKYLWERNARFHIPTAHGTYEQFINDTHTTIEEAIKEGNLKPVWGPQPYKANMLDPVGPKPPPSMARDDFDWGVGEEADLITLQPIWDPTSTQWTMRNKIWNFVAGIVPVFRDDRDVNEAFTHPDFEHIPRRAYINTISRFSRRQLHAMHLENLAGRSMQAEMWPATAALHHGLKAVFAPTPVWTDRKWPAWYTDAVFNADDGKKARWSQESDSVYAHDREHNFHGWSWYYDSAFPRVLYRRWLGWMAEVGPKVQFPTNPLRRLGGKKFEQQGVRKQAVEDGSGNVVPSDGGGEVVVGAKGRMCLPGMLLHPVKNVYQRAEGSGDEDDGGYEGFDVQR